MGFVRSDPTSSGPRKTGRSSKGALLLWVCFAAAILVAGCGQKEGEKGKVEKAVEEAVTKEFKMYEGAKQALEKVQKDAQEKFEKER